MDAKLNSTIVPDTEMLQITNFPPIYLRSKKKKKINALVSGNAGDKKIFTWAAAIFLIILIEFLK